jgi:hypothetical protein
MEILETWDKVWEIRMAEAQAAAEALEEIGSTAELAEAEALEEQQVLEEILLQATVLVRQDTKVDLAGAQEHLAEHQDQTIAGHLGLEWADLAEQDNTELQEAAEAAEALAGGSQTVDNSGGAGRDGTGSGGGGNNHQSGVGNKGGSGVAIITYYVKA